MSLLWVKFDALAEFSQRLELLAALEEKRTVVRVRRRGIRVGGNSADVVVLRRLVIVLVVREDVAHEDKPRRIRRLDAEALDKVVHRPSISPSIILTCASSLHDSASLG